MIKIYPLIFSILITFPGCQNSSQSQNDKLREIGYDTSRIAIIPLDEHQYYVFDTLHYVPGTINEEDINIIEVSLKESVEAYNDSLDEAHQGFKIDLNKNYKKQIVAAINQNGEKEVWVNCFCDTFEQWKSQIHLVHDGGPCYFNLKINLASKMVYDLIINGFA